MRHHKSPNRELIILHQRFETLSPILAESVFERFEDLCDIFVRISDKPRKFISERTVESIGSQKLLWLDFSSMIF